MNKKRWLALLLAAALVTQSGAALAAEIDVSDEDVTEEIVLTNDGEDVETAESTFDVQEEDAANEIIEEDQNTIAEEITIDDANNDDLIYADEELIEETEDLMGKDIEVMTFEYEMPTVMSSYYEQQVFEFLISSSGLGLNSATACGIMANIACESSFNPTASVVDTNKLTSYGICQWNGSRFTALKNYCGSSYNTIEGQLKYLKYELSTSEKNAWNQMQGIPNTQEGSYTAGYRWAQYFERCAEYYEGINQYQQRGSLAKNTYWPKYGKESSGVTLGTSATVANGIYKLSAWYNGSLMVDVAGHSNSIRANVQLGTNSNTPYQCWYVQYVGNGYYTLRNCGSGKYLDVAGAASASGTNVWQYDYNGHNSEMWQILPSGDGTYCLVPQCATTQALDVLNNTMSSGVNIQTNTTSGGVKHSERFRFHSSNGNFNTKNKVTFNTQGGTLPKAFVSHSISGYNTSRGENQLILYNVAGTQPNTNHWGIEVSIDSTGKIVSKRPYQSDTQLTVPSGGFIVSNVYNTTTYRVEFGDDVVVGNYVGVNYGTNTVSAYNSYSGYLAENKYVANGTKYGDLPAPTRSGYTFAGWYTAASGGTKITSSSTYSTNKLYAHWTCNHSSSSSSVTKQATCNTTGTKVYKCKTCGATLKTETIPATGNHTYKTTTTKAKPGANGKIVTKCSVCGKVKSNVAISAPKTVKLSTTTYSYNGKAQKPTVTVTDAAGKTIAASNYTVTYASGRKNVGSYKVTVKFKGTKYTGSLSNWFTVVPKGTTLKSVTAASKGFTAKWTKQATQTTGYQIQYTTNSNFTSGVKTVTIAKNMTVSTKVSKLTAKKKYYVRIRTYTIVSGKQYASAWSKAKAVTTKK